MSRRAFVGLAAAALLGACTTVKMKVNRSFRSAPVRRVAVIGFKDHSRGPGSGDAVTGAFELALLHAGYEVVGRDKVARAVRDQQLAGPLDAATAASVGRALGVDALVEGKILEFLLPRETAVDAVGETDSVRGRLTILRQAEHSDAAWTDAHFANAKTNDSDDRKLTVLEGSGKLGVSAKMVSVADGTVFWSGAQAVITDSMDEAFFVVAEDIVRAVKIRRPSPAKK